MSSPPPPVEWVGGDDSVGFWLGNWLALALATGGAYVVATAVFPPSPAAPESLYRFLGPLFIELAFIGPIDTLYITAVPCPRRIGFSPLGVWVTFPFRNRFFAWPDVFVRKKELVGYVRWNPWPLRIALSPVQRARLASFLRIPA
jgi:hypothetical protein